MAEWIRLADEGWRAYTDSGKYAALLLASLLYLIINKKKDAQQFLWYSVVMSASCIFPLTAALLMMYQTKFYDYQWIWTLVPTTAVIAVAATTLLAEIRTNKEMRNLKSWQKWGVAVLLVVMTYFSGNLQRNQGDTLNRQEQLQTTVNMLDLLREQQEEGKITLWAPHEILEYARAVDGDILLPYGRNMWDKALNAYSYDVYDEQRNTLYEWMENASETGNTGQVTEDGTEITLQDCLHIAKNLGVDCIILPGTLSDEGMSDVDICLGEATWISDSYLIFWL
ncbi:MAG: hypothetical protein K6G30_14560 [Acetatifactor sp.]|nr:hypothetical protein [Acetatifactor sp.]